MDSDHGKLFIGGISWETTEEKLSDYFGKYGDVLQTVVMRDKITGKPRGFGFVVFADPTIVDRVLQDTHTIDGRTADVLEYYDQTVSSPQVGMRGAPEHWSARRCSVGALPNNKHASNVSSSATRTSFKTGGTQTRLDTQQYQIRQIPISICFILQNNYFVDPGTVWSRAEAVSSNTRGYKP
ncbi:Heterogeneous nuclear ribonucleoprotein 1 [Platanthera guangdongensis]|uniref:Heterogeneous nuclear ribonucleoprotein 1 n=1 Tax=Platanthera guangdongensis TaxID=2320717 RepID=A0ABR2MJF1_9ASPA